MGEDTGEGGSGGIYLHLPGAEDCVSSASFSRIPVPCGAEPSLPACIPGPLCPLPSPIPGAVTADRSHMKGGVQHSGACETGI